MKKIWITLLLLLFITGCQFRYDIDINDGEITEKRTMLIDNSSVKNNDIKGSIENIISKYSINMDMMIAPETKVIKEKQLSGYQTITKYKLGDYKNSDILNMCYKSYNVIIDNSKIYLSTGREFTCYNSLVELENVEINITTNHKVLDHNADKVDGNKYSWFVTKSNASNKPINIELSETEMINSDDNKGLKDKFKIVFISIVAFFVIIVIIMLVIKRKRSQKIQ